MTRGNYDRTSFKLAKYCGVYAILNMETGETYIGSSSHLVSRFTRHLSNMRKLYHPNKNLQQAVQKYGVEAFTFVILEECKEEELFIRETFWLRSYNPEYNICVEEAGSMKGFVFSPESHVKMSESKKGNKNAVGHRNRLGIKHTPETIEYMRKVRIEYWTKRKALSEI